MSKILTVDDESAVREFCYKLFTSDNHRVITCARGAEVLKAMGPEKPDLILMDVQIPGEEGLSLLVKIQTQNPKQAVVVYSGVITADLEKEAYRLGAVDVVSKTLPSSDLRKRINQILTAKHRLHQIASNAIGQKILVVDDDEQIRLLLFNFFRGKGFDVLTAESGEEAIEVAERERPRLILLDISLPGIDGILTLKRIKEVLPDAGVVMATGLNDQQIAEESARLGAFAYVLKPFDIHYLELVVLSRLFLASGTPDASSTN